MRCSRASICSVTGLSPEGSAIVAGTALHALQERQGRFTSRQIQQTSITRYRDAKRQRTEHPLFPRLPGGTPGAGESRKYATLARPDYDDDDLRAIERTYDEEVENRRGAVPRYWEDVDTGESLPDMVKGPLTVTDNVAFLIGFGTVFVRAHVCGTSFASGIRGRA